MADKPFDKLNYIISSIIPNHIVKQLNMIWISNPYIYINSWYIAGKNQFARYAYPLLEMVCKYTISDTWSIFHFLWGCIMPLIIGPNRTLYALFIHTVWEGIEYILSYGGHPLFVEEAIDILWDTLLYMLGYIIISKYIQYSKKSYMKLPQYTV